MPLTLSKHLALASLFACLVVACSTSPTTSDAEALDQNQNAETRSFDVDTTGWTDERRVLEEEFRAWLQEGQSLAAAMAQGTPYLARATREKALGQQHFEGQFQSYIANSNDPDVLGWASLRS